MSLDQLTFYYCRSRLPSECFLPIHLRQHDDNTMLSYQSVLKNLSIHGSGESLVSSDMQTIQYYNLNIQEIFLTKKHNIIT